MFRKYSFIFEIYGLFLLLTAACLALSVSEEFYFPSLLTISVFGAANLFFFNGGRLCLQALPRSSGSYGASLIMKLNLAFGFCFSLALLFSFEISFLFLFAAALSIWQAGTTIGILNESNFLIS